jgi:hypothetical protein
MLCPSLRYGSLRYGFWLKWRDKASTAPHRARMGRNPATGAAVQIGDLQPVNPRGVGQAAPPS